MKLVWVRNRTASGSAGGTDPSPQIIYDDGVGPKVEVAKSYPLTADEAKLPLSELIGRYPAPVIEPES
jgi:hypothetical protein